MRIILMLCLFASYLVQGQSDTLQVNLKEIDSTGKQTVSTTIVGTIAGKLSSNGSISNTTGINSETQTALNNKSTISVGIDAGSNDSYVITATPAPSAYVQGMVIIFRANTVNTGAASLNVNGRGVVTIVKRVNTALANGDIPAQQWCMVVYSGSQFILLNPVVN